MTNTKKTKSAKKMQIFLMAFMAALIGSRCAGTDHQRSVEPEEDGMAGLLDSVTVDVDPQNIAATDSASVTVYTLNVEAMFDSDGQSYELSFSKMFNIISMDQETEMIISPMTVYLTDSQGIQTYSVDNGVIFFEEMDTDANGRNSGWYSMDLGNGNFLDGTFEVTD